MNNILDMLVEVFNGDREKAFIWYLSESEIYGKKPCDMSKEEITQLMKDITKKRGRGGWNLS